MLIGVTSVLLLAGSAIAADREPSRLLKALQSKEDAVRLRAMDAVADRGEAGWDPETIRERFRGDRQSHNSTFDEPEGLPFRLFFSTERILLPSCPSYVIPGPVTEDE